MYPRNTLMHWHVCIFISSEICGCTCVRELRHESHWCRWIGHLVEYLITIYCTFKYHPANLGCLDPLRQRAQVKPNRATNEPNGDTSDTHHPNVPASLSSWQEVFASERARARAFARFLGNRCGGTSSTSRNLLVAKVLVQRKIHYS